MNRRDFLKFFGLSPIMILEPGSETILQHTKRETLNEKDIIVFKTDRLISYEQTERIKEHISSQLNINNKIFILDAGINMEIMKR